MTEQISARCIICGGCFEYPKGGYEPKTCKRSECIRKFFHPELYKKEVMSTEKHI